ncbi:hydroxypyruvate reductase-like [Prorops nasuta]|uniref:hydroxypyruvate reductase-like n=1 Tax=Prorops nasuta TaxID=863751 RepID=UPI0034CF4D40
MSINIQSVLISDPVDESCGQLLSSHGIPVKLRYKLTKDELIEELQKHDALIVRSETKVTADVIAAVPNLRVIGRAGTGVDNIDLKAATRSGILVLNTPGGNSISACELTCALISSLARNVAQAVQSLKEGRWDRKLYSGSELYGKTLGVLGFGRIGREVATRMQSYGMKIVAFDPLLTEEVALELDVEKRELHEIWPVADYITVHTPLIPQTKNLINAETLAQCKRGVKIVNVARGGIVDEAALLNSINIGHCGGAGLDVFVEEPPKNPVTIELIKHPKVVATPHLGASTDEAQTRVAAEIAQQFLALSAKSSEYTQVNGIVNAPAMAAAMSPENSLWIELSKKLGQLAGRFLKGHKSVTVHSRIIGGSLANKKFLHTAVLVGVLSTQTNNGLNLINASTLATEIGINFAEDPHVDTGKEDAILIQVGQRQLKGTVRGDRLVLLSIDNSVYDDGVVLGDYISLYHAAKIQEQLPKVAGTYSANGSNIISLHASGNWLVVQTDQKVNVQIDAVEHY